MWSGIHDRQVTAGENKQPEVSMRKKTLAIMCVKTSMAATSQFYNLQTDSHRQCDVSQLL